MKFWVEWEVPSETLNQGVLQSINWPKPKPTPQPTSTSDDDSDEEVAPGTMTAICGFFRTFVAEGMFLAHSEQNPSWWFKHGACRSASFEV